MVTTPLQGEVWWAEAEDKRRPVLVVTRSSAVPVLRAVLVAPVTRTVRSIPTEVPLGHAEGLEVDCVAVFDSLQPVPRTLLTSRVGVLGPEGRRKMCDALRAMADC